MKYINKRLTLEKVNFQKIAKKFGTPFYCYSYSKLKENVNKLKENFKSFSPLICFAVKSNTNVNLIREIKKFGLGADVVSLGELMIATKAGIKPNKIVFSGVGKTSSELNFDEIREIALNTKPKLIICGYSAYPRTIDFESFRNIADEVGAFLMAFIAHIAGLVASKLHPNPIPYCDVVTTTTHKTLRGPRGGLILCKDAEFGKKFDKSVFPGTQGGPLEHIIAAKAVAFGEALQPDFVNYSQQVIKNAKVLASTLINRGIDIVSGGTDNHIVLLDLRSINMTGKIADLLVSEVNITANKNTVPFDPESPFVTSGLRLGTAALTTRGFNENAFAEVGEIIADRLLNPDDSLIESQCKERVLTLCNRFPLYEGKLEASIK